MRNAPDPDSPASRCGPWRLLRQCGTKTANFTHFRVDGGIIASLKVGVAGQSMMDDCVDGFL